MSQRLLDHCGEAAQVPANSCGTTSSLERCVCVPWGVGSVGMGRSEKTVFRHDRRSNELRKFRKFLHMCSSRDVDSLLKFQIDFMREIPIYFHENGGEIGQRVRSLVHEKCYQWRREFPGAPRTGHSRADGQAILRYRTASRSTRSCLCSCRTCRPAQPSGVAAFKRSFRLLCSERSERFKDRRLEP